MFFVLGATSREIKCNDQPTDNQHLSPVVVIILEMTVSVIYKINFEIFQMCHLIICV